MYLKPYCRDATCGKHERGDVLKAIPTLYDGTKFRSKLEAQWAKLLDHYGIPWTYESEGYEFEDGTKYLPDFWLPDSKQWLEVKGIMNDKDMHKCEMLAKESGHDVIIGYADGSMQMVEADPDGYGFDGLHEDVALVKCSECGKPYWMASEGYYGCRCCGYYDGDHFIGWTKPTDDWDEFATIDVMAKASQDIGELKPCPFCGNTVYMHLSHAADEHSLCWMIGDHVAAEYEDAQKGRVIEPCSATMWSPTFPLCSGESRVMEAREQLADAWNRRTP